MKKYKFLVSTVSLVLSFCVLSNPVGAQTENITLKDMTRLAIKRSFDIQLARFDAQISQADKIAAKSIYDLMFNTEANYHRDKNKRTSTIFGTTIEDRVYSAALSQKTTTGTTIGVDISNNRNASNSNFATSSVTHETVLGVSIQQDLGRNLFGIQDRGDVRIRLNDIRSSEYTSLDKIEAIIAETQISYWDLVLQNERIAIEKDMVEAAKKLYDLHEEKLADGLVELAEAIASEANYRKRQDELSLAQNLAEEKRNTLNLLLNIDDGTTIEPADGFKDAVSVVDVATSLKSAFEQRNDYKWIQNDLKSKYILVKMKKQSLWPEINLTASYKRNGLGDGFSESFENASGDEDNPDYSADVSIEFPLQNRAARAALTEAKLTEARQLVAFKSLERQIVLTIMNKVRDVNVYSEIAKSRGNVADLQEKKFLEEEKRFSKGRSNTDTLIRFQEDMIQARLSKAQADYAYHVALVNLNKEEGSLLKEYWNEEF